jgi:hypothetical protein
MLRLHDNVPLELDRNVPTGYEILPVRRICSGRGIVDDSRGS